MKILITGATGLLGTTLSIYLKSLNYEVITTSRSENSSDYQVDFADKVASAYFLDKINPDVIVNLIGLTSVEYCEENPFDSYIVNCGTVENIAHWLKNKSYSPYLLHISTDHFYDSEIPSVESDIVIRNYYAMSKYAGDLAAQTVDSCILRTNFVGRSLKRNRESMSDWVFNSLKKERKIDVLEDVVFNPLSINTLCKVIAESIKSKLLGVFNAGSKTYISKADFDFEFAKMLGLDCSLMRRISIGDAKFLKARRPKSMIMDVTKLESQLGIQLPSIHDEISRISQEYIIE